MSGGSGCSGSGSGAEVGACGAPPDAPPVEPPLGPSVGDGSTGTAVPDEDGAPGVGATAPVLLPGAGCSAEGAGSPLVGALLPTPPALPAAPGGWALGAMPESSLTGWPSLEAF
jgi:hypothetical protein